MIQAPALSVFLSFIELAKKFGRAKLMIHCGIASFVYRRLWKFLQLFQLFTVSWTYALICWHFEQIQEHLRKWRAFRASKAQVAQGAPQIGNGTIVGHLKTLDTKMSGEYAGESLLSLESLKKKMRTMCENRQIWTATFGNESSTCSPSDTSRLQKQNFVKATEHRFWGLMNGGHHSAALFGNLFDILHQGIRHLRVQSTCRFIQQQQGRIAQQRQGNIGALALPTGDATHKAGGAHHSICTLLEVELFNHSIHL